MDNNENNGFKFTYSAKEQAQIKRIREKYEHKEEDKMERLLRLDRGVTQKAQTVALVFGIVGALIMGFGMSLAISELSDILGMSDRLAMPIGILIGVIGGVLAGIAYPIYNLIVRRLRKKIAPEIIRLTDELMK